MTPLLLAARTGREDLMRLLLEAGANPKAKAQDGTTLLMQAIGSAQLPFVKFAFELDNDVFAVTDSGRTVMHATVSGTARRGTQDEICEVIQFLADQGAELDPLDSTGYTPIRIADILPIDKASMLLYKLILASGGTPKVMPSDLQ
jgi:cytohesin